MFMRKRCAFTLIELLIAITVLGILALAVMTVINPAKRQNQAKDAKIKADIDQIITGLQAYYTTGNSQTYPVNLSTLVTKQDIKFLPTPPNGGTYENGYQAQAEGSGACDEISSLCAKAKLSWVLNDPQNGNDVWCWQSSTGKAQELTAAQCIP